MATVECVKCQDTGWVCESHLDKPHMHFIEEEECGGAGQPCEFNKADPPWWFVPPSER